MTKATPKPTKRLFLLVITGLIITIILSTLVYLLGRRSDLGFQTFEPTYLPDGISATERKIFKSEGILFFGEYKSLEFKFSRPHMRLVESKDITSFAYDCYDAESFNGNKCDIEQSPGGQQYVHHGSNSPSTLQPASQRITLVKNDTFIQLEFTGTPIVPYSVDELDKIVDGFEPQVYSNLPIENLPNSD